MNRMLPGLLVCGSLIPLLMGPSCAVIQREDEGHDDAAAELTRLEQNAVKSAAMAAGALSQTTSAAQNAVGREIASGGPKPADLIGGSCPEVSTTTTLGSGSLDVTIDFGDGCVLPIDPEYSCAGSVTGELTPSGNALDLEFESLSCTGETSLTGQVSVIYDLSMADVSVSGQWSLIYDVEDQRFATSGSGTCSYDLGDLITEVTEFQGLLADGIDQWNLTMEDILVCYAEKESHVPYAGTMLLFGPNIRQLTIRFNENSPSTGEVQVSIAAGPFFTVDIYEL